MPEEVDAKKALEVANALKVYLTCLTSVLFWEVLSTLPKEIRLVWKPLLTKKENRLNLGSLAIFCFAVARWVCVIEFSLLLWSVWGTWTPAECRKAFYIGPVMSSFVIISASVIMALRVSAIWGRRLWVDLVLVAMWCSLVAVSFWAAYYVEPIPNITYCLAGKKSTGNQSEGLYLGPMAYDALILALTLAKAFKDSRNGSLGGLLKSFVRDGVLYFIVIFMCNLLAVAFEFQRDPLLKSTNGSLPPVGTSIFISRLFFAMRESLGQSITIPTYHSSSLNGSDWLKSPLSQASESITSTHGQERTQVPRLKLRPNGNLRIEDDIWDANVTQGIEMLTETRVDIDDPRNSRSNEQQNSRASSLLEEPEATKSHLSIGSAF